MSLPSDFLQKYGPWAVVTGASAGIGAEFARQLAGAGLSIVLVARREDRLQAVAEDLAENFPVQTRTVVADLSKEEGWQSVSSRTEDLDVGLLINNAGMEITGSFFRDPIERHLALISLNVTGVTGLAHAFGRRLADRGRGGMVFVSSMLAKPCPWFSTYSASKTFVSALSVILREELAPKGVDVLCLEPGVVETEMSARALADADFVKMGMQVQSADDCVKEALQSLHQKKAKVSPGLMNKVSLFVLGFIPESIKMKLMGAAMDYAMKPELREYA